MRAIVYGVLATLVLIPSVSNLFPWLQGRLNSNFPTLLLNLIGSAVWLGLAAGLVSEVVKALRKRNMSDATLRFALLAIACLPWMILAVSPDATTAFYGGFRGWAAASINDPVIRDWQAGLTQLPASTSAPGWWPTVDRKTVIGAQPVRGSLVPAVSVLQTSEVRVIPESASVLLAWEGGRAGWLRFAVVGPPGSHPPAEFRQEHVRWCEAKPGVWVGIMERP